MVSPQREVGGVKLERENEEDGYLLNGVTKVDNADANLMSQAVCGLWIRTPMPMQFASQAAFRSRRTTARHRAAQLLCIACTLSASHFSLRSGR